MRNRDLVRSLIDSYAVQGQRGLHSFHVALEGARFRALNAVSTPSAALLNAFGREARALLDTIGGNALTQIETDQRTLLSVAGLESNASIETAFDQVRSLVKGQYERDARMMRRHVGDISLTAHRRMLALGESGSVALAAAQNELQSHFRFTYYDRMGRRWEAARYMAVLLRGHYMDVINWAEMEILAQRGATRARVYRPGHKDHGREFSLVGNEAGLPSYDDLRREVFHPNSLALVGEVAD